MEIFNIKKEIETLKNTLDSSDKKYYHLRSIENFLYHFDGLSDSDSKGYVRGLLSECIEYYKFHSISNVFELKCFRKIFKTHWKNI